jgi:hypothetical protein
MPEAGKDLGADLYDLLKAGRDNLPSAATEYRAASRFIDLDPTPLFRRSYNLDGPYGPAYLPWSQLHDEMKQILRETADNLDAVGYALCLAADRYAAADAEAAAEFRRLRQVNGEPLPGGG